MLGFYNQMLSIDLDTQTSEIVPLSDDLLQKTLGGKLPSDKTIPWQIGFWIGAWDPDALSAYVLGALEIPYAS